MAFYRLDTTGTVRRTEPTPQGGMRVDAALTRTGILAYPLPDGTIIREYRPPDEVSRADSLATLRGAPVTLRHPPGPVTRANFRRYARGHVDGEARMDEDVVAAALVVQDDEALSAVARGVKEISCGYTCDIDETPGIDHATGERYDRIQRNIRYNHVALVEKGRAGSRVALRMDGQAYFEDDQMDPKEIAKLQTDLAAATLRADAADKALAAEKARADKTEGEALAHKTRADAAEKAVKERADADELASVSAVAAKILPELKLDGKTAAEIKAAVVSAKLPDLRVEGVRLDGAFDAIAGQAQTAPATQLRVAAKTPAKRPERADSAPTKTPSQLARESMMRREARRWETK